MISLKQFIDIDFILHAQNYNQLNNMALPAEFESALPP